MREVFESLTLRGRAFLAAGATALLCAIVLGQTPLVRIGVFVLLIPIVAALVVSRRRFKVDVTRTVTPRLVAAGQSATVTVDVAGRGGTALGRLLVEDQVPYALGTRPRFQLNGLGRTWQHTVNYRVRPEIRGEYAVGPLTIRTADPFGMLDMSRQVAGTTTLVVLPRTVQLPSTALGGAGIGSGDHRPRSSAAGSAEDVSVREYRRGDDLRRVHWRSSARKGELMVRREEQPWEARATVLLDNRFMAHRGRSLGSSFETAVSAAASLVVHLERSGYVLRFVSTDGVRMEGGASTPILERLATIDTGRHTAFTAHGLDDSAQGGLVVAVLGAVADSDLAALRRIRHHSDTTIAMVLDVDQWTGLAPDPARKVTAPVTSTGWRAVEVGQRDRLDAAWRALGRTRRTSSATRSAPTRGV